MNYSIHDLFLDASLHLCMRKGLSVGLSLGPSVGNFFMPKLDGFTHETHQGDPTMTLLNVHSVLSVLNFLNVLIMPKDTSMACWALFELTISFNDRPTGPRSDLLSRKFKV